jgi:PRTRC genetic system protein B
MRVVNAMVSGGFSVSSALLIHTRSGIGGKVEPGFATVHNVEHVDGLRPEIQAGQVVGAGVLESMLAGLVPERGLNFLESRVLASSSAGLVWWRKPAPAHMVFNTRDSDPLGQREGLAVQPGLVFAVSANGWKVWAMKGTRRPNPHTRLFQAPYYNVWSGGGICVGDAIVPSGYASSVIDEFERAFWESRFTHQNIHIKSALTLWPGGCSDLWVSLLNGEHKKFPVDSLVPIQMTLADVIAQASGVER